MKRSLVIYCFLTFSLSSIAQLELNASLSKDSVLVGQPTKVSLLLTLENKADTSKVTWLIPADSLGNQLEIINQSEPYLSEDGTISVIKDITISAESVGHLPIKPIEVKVGGKSLFSPPLLLSVYSTLQDPAAAEIRDYKESSQVRYTIFDFIWDNLFWIALGILILIGLVCFGFYLRTKKPKEKPEEVPVIVVPPIEIANKKLKELEAKELWQKGRLKAYHSEISYILREYLEGELNVSALENTSKEILTSLQKFGFTSNLLLKIKTTLNLTDLVKFAKQNPLEKENRRVLLEAEEAIKEIHSNVSGV